MFTCIVCVRLQASKSDAHVATSAVGEKSVCTL